MTYIINPMWFYWLSVADKICRGTCSLAILLAIFSATAYIAAAALKFNALMRLTTMDSTENVLLT